jgi:hypothetical protein
LPSFTTQATAADNLKSKLKEAGFDGIIGTWVEESSNGKNYAAVYTWKIEDRVIEVRTKDPSNETVALMGVNAASGQVFHMGADKQGASSLGKWKVDADGSAVLGVAVTGGDGRPFTLQLRHKMIGRDKMQVTIQLPQPIRMTLVRKK